MKAALYCRVSTDEQAEHGTSLQSQEEKCRAFADSQGLEVYQVYVDDGYSGASLERPAITRMLKDAELARFEVVIAYRTDRLSRSIADITRLVLKDFDVLGLAFKSVSEPFDTATSIGRLLFSQLAAFAEFERDTIRERTVSGYRKSVTSRGRLKGRPPYGYTIDDRGNVVLDPVASRVVRKIFDLHLSGLGAQRIRDRLVADGDPSSTGAPWVSPHVARILQNPNYTGRVCSRYKRRPNSSSVMLKSEDEWLYAENASRPAIVTQEEFEAVQVVIKSKRRSKSRTWSRLLLASVLVCTECGGRMYGYGSGSGPVYAGYRCGKRAEKTCKGPILWAHKIDHIVEEELLNQVRDIALLPKLDKRIEELYLSQAGRHTDDELTGNIAYIKSQLEQNTSARKRLVTLFEKTGSDSVGERLAELEQERKALELQLAQTESRKVSSTTASFVGHGLAQVLVDFEVTWGLADQDERKALMRTIVDKVMMEGNHPRIYWKPELEALFINK